MNIIIHCLSDVKGREAEVKTQASAPCPLPTDVFIRALGFLEKDLGSTAGVNRDWNQHSIMASLEKIQQVAAFLHAKLQRVLSPAQKDELKKINRLDPTNISSSTREKVSELKKFIVNVLRDLSVENFEGLRLHIQLNPTAPIPYPFKDLFELADLHRDSNYVQEFYDDSLRAKFLTKIPLDFIRLGDVNAAIRFIQNNFVVNRRHFNDENARDEVLVTISKALARKGYFDKAFQIANVIPEILKDGEINYHRTRALLNIVYALVDKALSSAQQGFLDQAQDFLDRAFKTALTIREKDPLRISDIANTRDKIEAGEFYMNYWSEECHGVDNRNLVYWLSRISVGPRDQLHQSTALRYISNAFLRLARLHPSKKTLFLDQALDAALSMQHQRGQFLRGIADVKELDEKKKSRINKAIEQEERERKKVKEVDLRKYVDRVYKGYSTKLVEFAVGLGEYEDRLEYCVTAHCVI